MSFESSKIDQLEDFMDLIIRAPCDSYLQGCPGILVELQVINWHPFRTRGSANISMNIFDDRLDEISVVSPAWCIVAAYLDSQDQNIS